MEYSKKELQQVFKNYKVEINTYVDNIISDALDCFAEKDSKFLDIENWLLSEYISYFDCESVMEKATEEEVKAFIKIVEKMASKNDLNALRAKAWGHYESNRAFKQDWKESEKYLLRLMDIDEEPYVAANSLGYIYYYGRTNKGKPDYDKAFKYFSIGAMGGMIESQYKLSDMFIHGHSVPKNLDIAKQQIDNLIDISLPLFCDGINDTKIADLFLRKARIIKLEINNNKESDYDIYDVLSYLLMAKYALKKRIKEIQYIGDTSVYEGICSEIDNIKEKIKIDKSLPFYEKYTVIAKSPVEQINDADIILHIKRNKDSSYNIQVKYPIYLENSTNNSFLLCIPSAMFCKFVPEINFITSKNAVILFDGNIVKELTIELPSFESFNEIFDGVYSDGITFNGKYYLKNPLTNTKGE